MPPSPAMRISPGRDLRTENHKRGRSLECGIRYQEKDDDLALFNEVQNKERENFLLQSNDDFDDIFTTKIRNFSDYKLGISIPARGESSDLLNAEGDKNDYDWLITPPETPLFSSLDDETPPVNLGPRGRPRSQPVPISRSPTMEKGYRSSRGSASPHRLSPSHTLQSRSRPFSATHSSPPPNLRHTSPSRRLSPPPNKTLPAPRSSAPTPRRMSTGSSASSRVRGTSPVKTSRGNSASPKIRAWQSNIPGFSSEAPPNLRTSLGDRPASYVRGSSPASRNGSRSGRQSMSPTASRSVSSSHSHERDPFSSRSKVSVASSIEDDLDSLHSIPVSNSDHSAQRTMGAISNNRVTGFSKKPTKILSSSVPKRSFDLALRQMERKGPQNMFRPLLSSVPSSTFYAGNASAHHLLTSRNSSITTGSNASSDQGTSRAHDTEESEQNQEDVDSDCVKGQYSDVHDEIFVMDHTDGLNECVENRTIAKSPSSFNNPPLGVAESSSPLNSATASGAGGVALDEQHGLSDADEDPDTAICSGCGRLFHPGDLLMEGGLQICLDCKSSEINSTVSVLPETMVVGENPIDDVQVLRRVADEVSDLSTSVAERIQVFTGETGTDHSDNNDGQHSYGEQSHNLGISMIDEGKQDFAPQQVINPTMGHAGLSLNMKADVSEGMGISLLLKRSNSSKGHILQNRSFTASNISYDEFSYTRDSVNSMRSSIGYSSASVSSSVDMGSSRQTEVHVRRPSIGHKSDIENYRYEVPVKHKRSGSSLSGASGHVFQVPSVTHEDSFEVTAANVDREMQAFVEHRDQSLVSECTEEIICTDLEVNGILQAGAETSHSMNVPSDVTSVMSTLASDKPQLHENCNELQNDSLDSVDAEPSAERLHTSLQGDDAIPSSCDEMEDGGVEAPYRRSLDVISEMTMENGGIISADSQSDIDSVISKSCMDEVMEPSISRVQSDLVTETVEQLGIEDPLHGRAEQESTVVLEDVGGTKGRSLTLDEATDAILFCSSIVHNLAYEAANIAIDKEKPSPMEPLRPTLTLVGKPGSDRRDTRSRNNVKRSPKSQKARQKKVETDLKPPSAVDECDEKSVPRIITAPDSMKPPPRLESKCNCMIM